MKSSYSRTPRPEGAIPIRWDCAQGWRVEAKSCEAFSLIELFVLIACLAVLALLILPALARQQRGCSAQRINCVNNLKQIGLSYRTWALDNQDKYPMEVALTNGGTMELINGPAFFHFLVMSNELSTPKILTCPQDSEKTNATTFSTNLISGYVPFSDDRYLSYFVGVDAKEAFPQGLLSGDRNLAVDRVPVRPGMQRIWTNSTLTWFNPRRDRDHAGGGNVCLADGSVQSLNDSQLTAQLQHTGMATNGLVIP